MHWHFKSSELVQPASEAAELMQEVAHSSTLLVKDKQGSLGFAGALVMVGAVVISGEVGVAGTEVGVVMSGGRVASQEQMAFAASITSPTLPNPQEFTTHPAALPWIEADEADVHWQPRSAVSVHPTSEAALMIQFCYANMLTGSPYRICRNSNLQHSLGCC